jgi:hypothetical protein
MKLADQLLQAALDVRRFFCMPWIMLRTARTAVLDLKVVQSRDEASRVSAITSGIRAELLRQIAPGCARS